MGIHIAEDGLMAKLRLEHEFPFRLSNPEPWNGDWKPERIDQPYQPTRES
jgi:hypothetical protein